MKKALSKNREHTASELLNEAPPLFRLPDNITDLLSDGFTLPAPQVSSSFSPSQGNKILITVLIPSTGSRVNLYLLHKDNPLDMFFNIVPGKYHFTASSNLAKKPDELSVVYVAGKQISEQALVK